MKLQQHVSRLESRTTAHRACALLSILLVSAPWTYAQQPSGTLPDNAPRLQLEPQKWHSRFTTKYDPKIAPPINMANSGRLDSLLRAGKLYLSLQDAIALALENNLDIEIQRYGPQIADTAVLRSQAGGFARGVSTSVQAGPVSAAGGATGGAGTAAQTGISTNAATQVSAATSTAVGSTVVTQTGSVIPNLDPTFTGGLRWGHGTTPQTSAFVTGTNSLIQRQDTSSFGIQKGFLTGTTVNL